MRPWEEEWYRNNDAAFLLGYNYNREVIGKVVKAENKDGGFIAAVKMEPKGEKKMIKSEAQKKYEEAVEAATQVRNEELYAEQREKAKENYLKGAIQLHDIYEAFITAGFTEEQAWKLLNSQEDLDIG